MSSANVIAATLGMDYAEMSQYRYQPGRTRQAIYAIGEQYFATGKRMPKDEMGGIWRMYQDQFFAKKNNTILWVTEAKKQ